MKHYFIRKNIPPGQELVIERCDNCNALRKRYRGKKGCFLRKPCDPSHIRDRAQLSRIVDRYITFYGVRNAAMKAPKKIGKAAIGVVMLVVLFVSCVPARNPEGKDYRKSDVLDRMFARRDRNRMYTDSGGAATTLYTPNWRCVHLLDSLETILEGSLKNNTKP